MNIKTRRSGTRSRTGCNRCVKVSRKCDEARPVCSRCARLSFQCVYEPRYIWKAARVTASTSASQGQALTTGPCSCPRRPTSPQLLEAFRTTGYKSMSWNTEGLNLIASHMMLMYESCSAIRAAVNAQMALSHDCCSVSALSRLDYAVSQTREFIRFVETQHDNTGAAIYAMLFLSQVSMRAGYPWTWQLERMHSLVLTMPAGPERQQHLEILGGLDMDVWIVGRQSIPLHIWATYCRGGEGIEEVTGLPRSLLDLISLASQRVDVSHELQQYSASLPQSQTHAPRTNVYRSLIVSALIYLQKEPLHPLLNELFTLLQGLRDEMPATDLGILAWPAYTLGYFGELQEYRFLAVDVLSAPSTSYLPDGTSALRGSPLGAMRNHWASIGVLDTALAGGCDGAEVGLW